MIFSQKHNTVRTNGSSTLMAILVLMSNILFCQGKIICDPPNWYTNTKYRQLDLLVRGIDFNQSTPPSVTQGNVKLISFEQMPNAQYGLLKIEIPENCAAQNVVFTFSVLDLKKKKSRKVELVFPILERSAFEPQGLNPNDLIYMIYPDRFANGDESNDSIPGLYQGVKRKGYKTRHGGDLQGITQHLDYVRNLHSTAVWLNPVLENNQPRDSYHGYATTHSYQVDARLGDNDQYLKFSRACHQNDMKVVWDVIYNHWGNEHYLFKNIPDSAWFHFYPTFTKTNYRAETLMDPYASEIDKDLMTNGWFDNHMPDLNQANPGLAKYLIQNSLWWVLAGEIDAYRIDTYAYPDQKFMADLNKALRDEFPDFFLFGETWVQSTPVQSYFTEQFKYAPYNSALNGVTDFQLYFAMTKGLNENFGWEEGLRRIQMTIAQDFMYHQPQNNVTFLDNHDLSRFYSVIGQDYNKWKAGVGMLLTLRGIPCVYYGTEYLLEGFTNPDDLVRQEFSGGWKSDDKNYFTQTQLTDREKEAFVFYNTLTTLRAESQMGGMMLKQFVPEDNIYVYFRYNEKKKYMVVVNLGDKTQLELNRFREILPSQCTLTEQLTQEAIHPQGILD
ncbi:MAG: alpha-amylase, partial [Bacteroidetes bacterium]|nr:alpha-amylase [Bacteroidota bacterium]